MNSSSFNSADFLDHHWFQNCFHLFRKEFWSASATGTKEFPPYTIKALSTARILDHVVECHSGEELAQALRDVPDDIMLFLSRFVFPAEELAKKLSQDDFFEYYDAVFPELEALMKKYGAG
jgi:hypothetical protein